MSTNNVLPTDLHGKITMLQNILVARATGNSGDVPAFVSLRSELMTNESLRDKLPESVRTCRDLDQFWGYIKQRASTYAERRRIIWNEFGPLLDFLEVPQVVDGGSMPNEVKTTRGHCPKCGPDRRSLVRGEHHRDTSHDIDDGQFSVEFSNTYRILECAGCETIFCQHTVWCSEWYDSSDPKADQSTSTYWPSTTQWRPAPWLDNITDSDLKDLMVELYTGFNNGMPVLAAIGVRTTFDRATELLGIDPSLPFGPKLDRLAALGMLSSNDRIALAALIDAGSAAAHRGWKPTDESLSTMLHILEAFVHKEIILKPGVGTFVSSIPPKPKRKP